MKKEKPDCAAFGIYASLVARLEDDELKLIAKILFSLLFIADAHMWAQATSVDTSDARTTPARGFWVDPETSLMWAGSDNGRDLSWHAAVKYCRRSRLAGFADWRLADIDELWALNLKRPVLVARPGTDVLLFNISLRVRGNLHLTGDEWSVTHPFDDDGRQSSFAYYFDFVNRLDNLEDASFFWGSPGRGKRALCVRGMQKQVAAPSTNQ